MAYHGQLDLKLSPRLFDRRHTEYPFIDRDITRIEELWNSKDLTTSNTYNEIFFDEFPFGAKLSNATIAILYKNQVSRQQLGSFL